MSETLSKDELKKLAKSLKIHAKNLGYDVKLTHAQEIIARMNGFKSRNAVLSKNIKEKVFTKETNWFYYELHVFQGLNEGYSTGFRAHENWDEDLNQSEIIERARELDIFQWEAEYSDVDYINKLDEEEYFSMFAHSDKSCECMTCGQLFKRNQGNFDTVDNALFICHSCDNKQVKAFISTDDGYYHYFEFDCRSYLETLDKNDELISLLKDGHFGPDYHTDSIYYNLEDSVLKEIAEYLGVINKRETTGFSISVDEDSFERWYKKFYKDK